MGKLSLRRRLALEIDRKRRHILNEEHPLTQLFWECTQRCNLNCRHCGSDCKTSSVAPDMPAGDFLKAIDSILPHVDRHRLNIVITGGEPLVRRDLEDVGLELYRRELPWGIVSNGLLLTPRRFDSLRRAGIHNLTISLDGDEDDHNWLRGNPESYRRAISAIKMAAAADDLNFDVVTCVNRRTIGKLPEIAGRLEEADVRNWRLFTIFPSGRARQYPEFNLTADEFVALMEYIKAKRLAGGIRPSYCCEGFLGDYEGDVRSHFFRCTAGVTTGSILIDGSIAACPSIRANYTQGNIYTDDFWDVWQNRYQQYRDHSWMKTGICTDCDMFRYCEGNGFHLREEDGTIKHCYYHTALDRKNSTD